MWPLRRLRAIVRCGHAERIRGKEKHQREDRMTADERRGIERDVEKVAIRFFHYLDSYRYDDLAGLFTPDGVWHRQGKELRGSAALLAAMHARPAGTVTQHVASNILVDVLDADHAETTIYLTVYAHAGDATTKPPVPMSPPGQVGIYREKLARTPDGWRIAEITSQQIFKR
jgi:hypothetical protein